MQIQGMRRNRTKHVALIACSFALALAGEHYAAAQNKEHEITVTTTEPGRYRIQGLYDSADIVAHVEVLSGDTEHYETAVYKVKVKENFKGVKQNEIIYMGPYVGLKLGSEYVLFLRKTDQQLKPKQQGALDYGPIVPATIMNQGYGAMEVGYWCGFAGKEIKDQCDYAVRVCTDYIRLPDNMPISPPMTEDTPFGCRWVRKDSLLSLLKSLRK